MGCGASKQADQPQPERSAVRLTADGVDPGAAEGGTAQKQTATVKATGLADRPDHHVSKAAVSLAFLLGFMEEHRLRERQLTTAQLVAEVVKPATAAAQCRYTDLMLADPAQRDAVSQGRPFFFISHAWGRRFTDTLDMVARHFAPEQQRTWRKGADGQPLPPLAPKEVFVWFDMFAINQHQVSVADDSDLAALWEAVQDAQATLMVLDAQGTLLTRIWCLYEAWQSGRAGPEKLRLLSYGIHWQPLQQVFIDLDVGRAQATVAADRDRILDDIRRDVGSLDAMTLTLKDALVAGAVAQVPSESAAATGTPGTANNSSNNSSPVWDEELGLKLFTAAMLCKLYGKLRQAEPLYRRDLAGRQAVLGPDHPLSLSAANNLGQLLRTMGEREEAEGLLRQALEGLTRVVGPDAEDTLVAASNLAGIMRDAGRYEEAEQMYRRALAGYEAGAGPDHPDTLTVVSCLATVLEAREEGGEAERLYRRALEGRERALGPDHPDTLTSANNVAGMLERQGRHEEAEALFRRVLRARERVLGPDHPDTLSTLNNLAYVLDSTGRHGEAEEAYRRALAGQERVVGQRHPDTLSARGNLAATVLRLGRHEAAAVLFRRVAQEREEVLGPDHPDTLSTLNNLAFVLEAQGACEEAEGLYRRALAGQRDVLGPDHPETLSTANNLVQMLQAQGRLPVPGKAAAAENEESGVTGK